MGTHETELPPQNLEAEQCLLGSMILDPETVPDVLEALQPDDFYAPAHQYTFEAIKSLEAAAKPVDLAILAAALKASGKLDLVGGAYFLACLPESVPNASHALEYAALIRLESWKRAVIRVGEKAARDARNFQGSNPAELVDAAEAALLALDRSRTEDHSEPIGSLLHGALARVDAAERGQTPEGVVRTQLKDLDTQLGGLAPGGLYILAARPSMGKSSLATTIARNVAIEGDAVALFTLEVTREQVADTMLAAQSRQSLAALHKPGHTDVEIEALTAGAKALHDKPLIVDDTPMLTLMRLRSRARRLARKHNLALIIIDYLQLLTHDDPKSDSRQGDVSAISAGLKSLARELAIPIVALSQLNRGVEARTDKRPMLSDLRESGAIEQDADAVLMLYRDHYYNPTPHNRHEAQVIVAKNRFGPTGSGALRWTPECVRFDDDVIQFDNFNMPPGAPAGAGTW